MIKILGQVFLSIVNTNNDGLKSENGEKNEKIHQEIFIRRHYSRDSLC